MYIQCYDELYHIHQHPLFPERKKSTVVSKRESQHARSCISSASRERKSQYPAAKNRPDSRLFSIVVQCLSNRCLFATERQCKWSKDPLGSCTRNPQHSRTSSRSLFVRVRHCLAVVATQLWKPNLQRQSDPSQQIFQSLSLLPQPSSALRHGGVIPGLSVLSPHLSIVTLSHTRSWSQTNHRLIIVNHRSKYWRLSASKQMLDKYIGSKMPWCCRCEWT